LICRRHWFLMLKSDGLWTMFVTLKQNRNECGEHLESRQIDIVFPDTYHEAVADDCRPVSESYSSRLH
jgi:hypothetical protein